MRLGHTDPQAHGRHISTCSFRQVGQNGSTETRGWRMGWQMHKRFRQCQKSSFWSRAKRKPITQVRQVGKQEFGHRRNLSLFVVQTAVRAENNSPCGSSLGIMALVAARRERTRRARLDRSGFAGCSATGTRRLGWEREARPRTQITHKRQGYTRAEQNYRSAQDEHAISFGRSYF